MELKNLIISSEVADIYQCDKLAVKLYKEGRTKTEVFYEALTQSRVEEVGLKVPAVHEVSQINGRWSIQMDFVEGKTLAELMDEDPDHIDKYIEQMLNIQLEIHTKQMPRLRRMNQKLEKEIESLTEIDESKKYELLTKLNSMPKHRKLCHGNFRPRTIIVNKEGNYVLNWVEAGQGNASMDVANTYLLLCLKYPQKTADKYLELFCKKTNTDMKYVQDWLPIVAASRLMANRPEEKDLLMKWLDVIEFQ